MRNPREEQLDPEPVHYTGGISRSTLQALLDQMRKPPTYKGSPVATSGDSYSMVEARYRAALYWADKLAAILAAAPEQS